MPIETVAEHLFDDGSGRIGELPGIEGVNFAVTIEGFPPEELFRALLEGRAPRAENPVTTEKRVATRETNAVQPRRRKKTYRTLAEKMQILKEAEKARKEGRGCLADLLRKHGIDNQSLARYQHLMEQEQRKGLAIQETGSSSPVEVQPSAATNPVQPASPIDPPDVPPAPAQKDVPQAPSVPTPAPIGDIHPSGNPNAPVDAMGSARPQVMDRKVDNVETQEHRFIRWAQTLTCRYTTESSGELVRDLFDTYHERIRHALRDHRAVSDTKSTANAQIDEAFVLALRKFEVPRPGEDVVHFFVVRTERFLGRSRARPTHGTPSQVPSPVHKEDPKEMMEQIMAAALQAGFKTFEDEYAVQWRANATAYMSRDVSVKKLRKEILGTEARTSNLAVQALLNHMKGIMREVVDQRAFLFENGGYVLRGIVARMAWCIYSYEGSAEGLEEAVRAALTLCVEEKEKKLAAPQH